MHAVLDAVYNHAVYNLNSMLLPLVGRVGL